VLEAADGSLVGMDVARGHSVHVAANRGLLPVRRTSSATSGADTPRGDVLLAPSGRLDRPSDGRLVDAAALTVDRLEEVVP